MAARIEFFTVAVTTGKEGRPDVPTYKINGFEQPLTDIEGGCGPGETLKAKGEPRSFAHSLLLSGPEEGAWDVASFTVTYHLSSGEPYTVRFGSAVVESDADLNIHEEPPLPVFDV